MNDSRRRTDDCAPEMGWVKKLMSLCNAALVCTSHIYISGLCARERECTKNIHSRVRDDCVFVYVCLSLVNPNLPVAEG